MKLREIKYLINNHLNEDLSDQQIRNLIGYGFSKEEKKNTDMINRVKVAIKELASMFSEPGKSKDVGMFLIKNIKENHISFERLEEDLPGIKDSLKTYYNNQSYINRIANKRKLLDFNYSELKKYEREINSGFNAEVSKDTFVSAPLAQGGDYKLYKVTDKDTCVSMAQNTKWCVKDVRFANNYLEKGPLYLVTKNDRKFALLHFETKQYMDVNDNELSLEVRRNIDKKLNLFNTIKNSSNSNVLIGYAHFIEEDRKEVRDRLLFLKDPERAYEYAENIIQGRWPEAEPIIKEDPTYAYYYAENIIKDRWPEAEPIIMKNTRLAFVYAHNVIKGRWEEAEPIIMKDPERAYEYARDVIRGRWPEAEPIIMKDPERAYEYARDVIRGRWPELEPIIIKEPRLAYWYAKDVIEGRWLKAEPIIIKEPQLACGYAEYVIRGRWPEAEPSIMEDPERAYRYVKDVINKGKSVNDVKKRWPEAEEIIKEDPTYAYYYALKIIGSRWPEAEPIIIKKPQWAYKYAEKVIGDRWPEAEPAIMKNPKNAYRYVVDVINKDKDVDDTMERWPEAEPVIMKDPKIALKYTLDVINRDKGFNEDKERWLEAEHIIMKDSESAFHYAFYVFKGRWPEAEHVILKDPYWGPRYKKGFMQEE